MLDPWCEKVEMMILVLLVVHCISVSPVAAAERVNATLDANADTLYTPQ